MMSEENIIAIIKWVPLIAFLLAFLLAMLCGMAKGRRKTIRRFIYVILYVVLIFIFTPKITESVLQIQINGMSINGYIDEFIQNNEQMQKMFEDIPGLESLLENYPTAICSLVFFIVLIFVGLPLSFPVYLIYIGIYALISRYVFKYTRFKRDENGKIVRNEKGKKTKIKRDKHRLTAGLIKGAQSVVLTSTILVPVGVVTRLYQDGKDASVNKDLASIEDLEKYEKIFKYLDVFNDSLIGKAANSTLNKKVAGYLTPIETDEGKTTMEAELNNIVVAAVYLEECGLIKLLSGNIDIKTLDLTKLDIDKLDAAIEILFKSSTLKSIVADGVNYVLENNLKETLVKYTDDGDIIEKLKYNNANEVKQELLRVTDILREIINSKLLTIYQGNTDNVIGIVNEISTKDVETILNKVLSVQILSKSMPGIVTKLLKNQGLTSTLTTDDNNDFVKLVVNVVSFVKTLDLENVKDISEGDVLNNVIYALYKDGAIKENSMESLAVLLADITSSRVFDEVLVTQLNNLLAKYEIELNSQMIVNVNTKEDWKKELLVLENIFDIYDKYKNEEKVDFLVANELVANLKETKALILAFPIAYQKLFPLLGIEVDSTKIAYIDYSKEDADEQEAKFYNYWKQQLVHLENISLELAKLKITSVSDISLNMLELEENRISLSKIVEEIFTADLIKNGVTQLLNDTIARLLLDYEIVLNEGAITSVNKQVDTNPYYVIIDNTQYDIEYKDDKYYIDNTEVVISENSVTYNSNTYELNKNSLTRIWNNELTNLANIVSVIKTGEYTSKKNLTIILDSVDDMALLKEVKVDLLMYAVKQLGILTGDEYNSIDKKQVSFTKEKNILLNIIDEYDVLKDMSNINLNNMSDETIESLSRILTNVLSSDILGNYAASTITTVANTYDINISIDDVKQANTWEADLKLMKKALSMNKDAFNKSLIEEILNGIESSSLLSPIKEELLLNTIRKVTIEGVVISSDLKATDIIYADEKNAILVAADNLSLLENIKTMNLETIDTNSISNLLAASLKSKLFSDSVVNNLVSVFNSNGIKHDMDISDNSNLISSIKSIDTVEKWQAEITKIKSLMEVDTKEEVSSTIFTTIESSNLLGGCKANLLLKVVNEINNADLNLNVVSVDVLKANDYKQYLIEKELLAQVVNISNMSNITSIDSVNDQNKSTIATALNAMSKSLIFANKYDSIVSNIVNSSINNQNVATWGLSSSNNEVNDWNKELDSLLTIKNNAQSVSIYNSSNYDVNLIGSTLDAIDNSSLISGSENAANKIIKNISGSDTATITKEGYTSWTGAFQAKIDELNN